MRQEAMLQEIERIHQLVSHQIEVDRKIDPARANENVHIAVPAVQMALSQILASALPDAELQLILKYTQSQQYAFGQRAQLFEYSVEVSTSVS